MHIPRDVRFYNDRLTGQMIVISKLGPQFLAAIRAASASRSNPDLVQDATRLQNDLNGPPGSGVAEVYNELPQNIHQAQAFVERWSLSHEDSAVELVRRAQDILSALEQLQTFIDTTPSELMSKLRSGAESVQRFGEERAPMTMGCWIVSILAMLALYFAYAHFFGKRG